MSVRQKHVNGDDKMLNSRRLVSPVFITLRGVYRK